MKIMGAYGDIGGMQGKDVFGFDVNDSVLILHFTGDKQELFACDQQAVALI